MNSFERTCLLKFKFVPYGNRLDVSSSPVSSVRVFGMCDFCSLVKYCDKVVPGGPVCSGLVVPGGPVSDFIFDVASVDVVRAKRNSRLSVGDDSNYRRRNNQRYVVSKIAQNFIDLCKSDEDVYFVTLTLRKQTDDVNLFKKYMRLFIWRLRNHDIALTYFYVVEKHKSGKYHYHMLIKVKKSLDLGIYNKTVYGKNKKLKQVNISKVFDELWDFGFNTTILITGNKMKFVSYLSKYLSKAVSSDFPPNFKIFNFSRDCVFVSFSIMVLDKTVRILPYLMGAFDIIYANFKHASKIFTFSLDGNVGNNVFGVLKGLKKMFFWWFRPKDKHWDSCYYRNVNKYQNYVALLASKMYDGVREI